VIDDDDEALEEEVHELVAVEDARLDVAIVAALGESALSRAQVQRLIDDGRARVAGAVVAKPSARVKAGDAIELRVPAPEPIDVAPEPIPLAILYEDAELIVVDKPPGLVVHPAAGHASGTLVNALLYHCKDLSGIGGALRPGIVHRLDRDTSGAMVATKTDRAHAALAAAFASKSSGQGSTIRREYLAICAPPPSGARGELRTLYGRHPVDRKRFSSKVAAGKSAVTRWELVEPLGAGAAALVRFQLETGRTHQIRVHASDHGFAVIADAMYGPRPRDERVADAARAIGRQALHAAVLAFDHPVTGARVHCEAPLPEDFARALALLG
jgi:23S rRNA pseudouridine1911/1915/1917 synthase